MNSIAQDIAFTLIGSGDCFDELVALRDQPNLAVHVEFTGRVPHEHVTHIMSTRYSRLMRHVRQAQASLYGESAARFLDVSKMEKMTEL